MVLPLHAQGHQPLGDLIAGFLKLFERLLKALLVIGQGNVFTQFPGIVIDDIADTGICRLELPGH
jgi:hypothetical protein